MARTHITNISHAPREAEAEERAVDKHGPTSCTGSACLGVPYEPTNRGRIGIGGVSFARSQPIDRRAWATSGPIRRASFSPRPGWWVVAPDLPAAGLARFPAEPASRSRPRSPRTKLP